MASHTWTEQEVLIPSFLAKVYCLSPFLFRHYPCPSFCPSFPLLAFPTSQPLLPPVTHFCTFRFPASYRTRFWSYYCGSNASHLHFLHIWEFQLPYLLTPRGSNVNSDPFSRIIWTTWPTLQRNNRLICWRLYDVDPFKFWQKNKEREIWANFCYEFMWERATKRRVLYECHPH